MRLALTHGYDLAPCYSFGEAQAFSNVKSFLSFRLWLNRFGVPGILPVGCPWYPLMPRREAKVISVVGGKICLPRLSKNEITDEVVDKWHALYVEQLELLFERYKVRAGLEESTKLEIW